MNTNQHRSALIALLLMALSAPAGAQDLAEVEKKIIAAGDKVKSFTAEMTTSSQIRQAGMTMETSGKGTIELLRHEGKVLWRLEQKTATVTEIAGQKQNMEVTTLAVTDGEFTYVLMEQSGQKQVIKSKAESAQPTLANKETFEQLHKDSELRLLPEAKLDGRSAYVIEATPKDKSDPMARQTLWFDKESGMLLKMEVVDEQGRPLHTSTFSNYKTNVTLKPERFRFQPPEGVPVIDMTQAPRTP